MATETPRMLVVRPNASLSARQAAWVLGGMCLVTFGIAGAMAALGFWMILPFAGLEMACLAAALHIALRDNHYREVIRVDGQQLAVERGRKGPEKRWECALLWAQVLLIPPRSPTGHVRVLLRCSGQTTEVGRVLAEDDKAAFAADLRRWLAQAQQAAREWNNAPMSGSSSI